MGAGQPIPRAGAAADSPIAALEQAGGAVRGLVDWPNALIGDPAMELGRLAEYALLPQNGLGYQAVLSGYREPGAEQTSWTAAPARPP